MLAADGNHVLGHALHADLRDGAAPQRDARIHASGSHLGGGGVELFPQFIQAHTCSTRSDRCASSTSVIFRGYPERFPDLRIAFLEAGCGWGPTGWSGWTTSTKRAPEAPALKKEAERVRPIRKSTLLRGPTNAAGPA